MPNHRSRGAFAVVATVMLLALVTAGCGRRGLAVAGAEGEVQASPAAATSQPAETTPAETAATAAPVATEPTASSAPPTVPPAPLATPDLGSIERLLAELDAALGADAAADTDEGSPK